MSEKQCVRRLHVLCRFKEERAHYLLKRTCKGTKIHDTMLFIVQESMENGIKKSSRLLFWLTFGHPDCNYAIHYAIGNPPY